MLKLKFPFFYFYFNGVIPVAEARYTFFYFILIHAVAEARVIPFYCFWWSNYFHKKKARPLISFFDS
jgi:hypothetical protein